MPQPRVCDRRHGREARRAHVDGHLAIVLEPRSDDPAGRLDANLTLVREPPVAHEPDEAARAVAALLDLAAVGVEDPVAKVDVGARRPLDDEHLVAAHAKAAVGERADLARGEGERLDGRVDDDEVVAEPVHLRERERRHGFAPDVSPRRTNGKRLPSPSVTSPAIS